MEDIDFFEGLYLKPKKKKLSKLNVKYSDLLKNSSKPKKKLIKRLKKVSTPSTPIFQGSTKQKDEIAGFI